MEQSSLYKNPNKARNRIPLASERKTLQFALQIKLNNQSYLDDMIKSTEEKQRVLEMQRNRLWEELEAKTSEICSLNECKATAIAQKRMLEPSINELKGLLHPIRYCPDEILREIFQASGKQSSEYKSIQNAVTLSHVCQYWRKIALGTASLWSKIPVRLRNRWYEKQNQRLPRFWESILPRLRNRPVTIYLDAAYEDPPTDGGISHLVPLIKIPNIHTIHLFLCGAYACNAGLDLFRKLTRPVDCVRLTLASRGVYDLSPILSRAGRLRLVVENEGIAVTKRQEQYDNLKCLYLSLPRRFNVSNVLQSCFSLRSLEIKHPTFAFDDLTLESTAYSFPNLQYLYAHSAGIRKSILNPLSTCPKLEHFEHWGHGGTPFLDFVRRHPWINSISIDSREDLLMLSDLLPNLTSLTTGWDSRCIKFLHSWEEDGINQCPFPKMDCLFIDHHVSLPPNSTEQILNRRALGPKFETLHAQGVIPLRILEFKQDRESDKEWLENPTLEFAEVAHIEDKDNPNILIYTIMWHKVTERS